MNWAPAQQQHRENGSSVPASAATSLHELRTGRLQRGLASLGVGPGDKVAIVCCDRHVPDHLVASAALDHLGAIAVIPSEWTHAAMSKTTQNRPKAVLACEEGVTEWRDVNGTGIVIGEGPNILWWKSLGRRYSHADSAASA